jgi:hypothetical protein
MTKAGYIFNKLAAINPDIPEIVPIGGSTKPRKNDIRPDGPPQPETDVEKLHRTQLEKKQLAKAKKNEANKIERLSSETASTQNAKTIGKRSNPSVEQNPATVTASAENKSSTSITKKRSPRKPIITNADPKPTLKPGAGSVPTPTPIKGGVFSKIRGSVGLSALALAATGAVGLGIGANLD